MQRWVLVSLVLKRLPLSRDVRSLILRHLYPFRYETHWLRNERVEMARTCRLSSDSVETQSLFIDLVDAMTRENVLWFLDTYQNQADIIWAPAFGFIDLVLNT